MRSRIVVGIVAGLIGGVVFGMIDADDGCAGRKANDGDGGSSGAFRKPRRRLVVSSVQ